MILSKQVFFIKWSLAAIAASLLSVCLKGLEPDQTSAKIVSQIDVAPAWSVHRIGPPELLTRDGLQYVAYYDHDRFLTLAQRELNSSQWKFHRFPVQMGWATGGHANLSLAIDNQGYVHITCYRRGLQQGPPSPPQAIYYRSTAPHSVDAFERLHINSATVNPHYPTFYTVDKRLYFSFREGGSGSGNRLLKRYDDDRQLWQPVFESPLLDGRGERGSYISGPKPGPDGRWHLLWVWRETPCHSTNNSLSYARTVGNDLNQWESAAGVPVTPPFTIDQTELLVDASPPGGGLSNVLFTSNWDSKNRLVVSYHRFDETGASQIYNARFQDGKWMVVPATRWDFIWGDDYVGGGAIGPHDYVRVGKINPSGNGELTQEVWNRDAGGALMVLDEDSLTPLRQEPLPPPPQWRRALTQPESDFQVEAIPALRRAGGPMQVNLISDTDGSQLEGIAYYLRWEHAGTNRDQPVPKPWPQPTLLRVYKISQ